MVCGFRNRKRMGGKKKSQTKNLGKNIMNQHHRYNACFEHQQTDTQISNKKNPYKNKYKALHYALRISIYKTICEHILIDTIGLVFVHPLNSRSDI